MPPNNASNVINQKRIRIMSILPTFPDPAYIRQFGTGGAPLCRRCHRSGQIMSASALLASNAHPTDSDIDAAMSGNICRCGTYLRIREAIKQAAQSSGQGG